MHLAGKQIILSANCSPQELQLIEPRLVSRFEWGIVLPLLTLAKTRALQILKIKAEALQFELPSKIATYLADTFVSNPKALTKALEAFILRVHLDAPQTPDSLTLSMVQSLLSDLII